MTDEWSLGNFESALGELETLVERLERGDGVLAQALADFERGIQLVRQCQNALDRAEQRVEQLLTEDDRERLAPFTEEQPQ